ncbi:MAG: hypothetical protein A2X59_10815 [Nitrospirae bacterium GWC2_42_7]|nr:MAG: hypothetical protein A2X59_10815 [Nitrospirae bacterium GWC2_42_7]
MLYIEDKLKEALAAQGFSSYNSFIEYKGGLRVSRKSKRDVRTIELLVGGKKKNYFIKLARVEPFKRVLQSIRKSQFPHSKVLKELQMLKFFEEQNIPVMRAMAWGEKCILGWPVSGFLLLEEVKGKEFVELFKKSGSRVRRQMMRGYGALVGHVHKKGINAKVRPRDIICVSDDFSDYSKAFVLIDRERGNPFPVDMPMKKCAAQLATLLTKSIQNIGMPEKGELLAFLVGYFSGNRAFYEKRNEFVSIAAARIKQLMEKQERYKEIRETLLRKYQLR